MEKLVQLFPHEVKRIFSKYGPIHKQTSDYQDLQRLFVTPIYYGFKEYFNRKKNSDKLEFYAYNFFWKSCRYQNFWKLMKYKDLSLFAQTH